MEDVKKMCFNTSHVTVQLHAQRKVIASDRRFNTSHVTVQLQCNSHLLSPYSSFNTSHVTVQREVNPYVPGSVSVSIHPMLLFNTDGANVIKTLNKSFNTSHVTVQQI